MEVDNNSLHSETLGKSKKKKRNNYIIPSFLLDIAILACLTVFAYYLRFTNVFTGFSRYFKCNDENLMYPFYGGGDEANNTAVSHWVLFKMDDIVFYCVTPLLPPAIILIGELIYMCIKSSSKVVTTCCDCFCIPLIIRRICRHVGTFWIGFMILSITTDSIKILSGCQRPYFLTLIEQLQLKVNTTNKPYCIFDISTNDDVRDASLSFPSYHSTMAAYSCAFAMCYVQMMLRVHGSHFFRPILLAGLSSLAVLAGYSQWMLYRNDWLDISVGYVLGILAALYLSVCVLNCFHEHKTPQRSSTVNDGEMDAERMMEEARPAIFRWLNIPRLTMRGKPDLSGFQSPYGEQNVFEPNNGFQDELTNNYINNSPQHSTH